MINLTSLLSSNAVRLPPLPNICETMKLLPATLQSMPILRTAVRLSWAMRTFEHDLLLAWHAHQVDDIALREPAAARKWSCRGPLQWSWRRHHHRRNYRPLRPP